MKMIIIVNFQLDTPTEKKEATKKQINQNPAHMGLNLFRPSLQSTWSNFDVTRDFSYAASTPKPTYLIHRSSWS